MIHTLFDDILRANNHTTGWCTIEKQFALASAVVALRPAVSIELGIWGGKSFFPMAFAHRAIGSGKLIGVDPWNNTASVQGQPKEHADWWKKVDHEPVYNDFMRLRKDFHLELITEIYRITSDDYNPLPGTGLLHIDANHGQQSILDVERYAPTVLKGGLVFCDDLSWGEGAVETSIQKLVSLGFRELYRVQNKARGGMDDWCVMQRIK